MEKKLYTFSYSPVQRTFEIELTSDDESLEYSPLLISHVTENKETVWFNMWSTGNGIYIGNIELSDNNFKHCLSYIVELIENY